MPNIYSQLIQAQLENLGSDPTPGIKGLAFFNTADGLAKFDDGSAIRTLITADNTQTLTNKKLSDSTTTIIDNVDGTKIAAFQCSGITAGQTRTMTVPDRSGTIPLSGTPPTTKGDLLVYTGTDLVREAVGTNDHVLTADSTQASGVKWAAQTSNPLSNYRRPVLQWVSITAVDVENNTGTANQTSIVFPDGTTRSVTEDTASTHKYRRFIITANAEFSSGTEDSGLRGDDNGATPLSEANNTTYAIYAVKSTIDATKFVLVGDTRPPTQANFAALNTAYGTNGWIYLGYIFNGDGYSAAGDICDFVQSGNFTQFRNLNNAIVDNGFGVTMANTAGATTLTYTYAAGMGNTQIPDTVSNVIYEVHSAALTGNVIARDSSDNSSYYQVYTAAGIVVQRFLAPASLGVKVSNGPATSVAYDILMAGFYDTALGIGGNPLR